MSDFSQRIQSLSPAKKELLARQLKKKGTVFNSFPLSFAQQRLWLLDQLDPGNPSYNVATTLRFRGRLHIAALQKSFAAIVQRHEILRTTFAILQGQPVQVVAAFVKLSLPVIDLGGLNEQERATEIQLQADKDARYSFNLAKGPLLRINIFRMSDQEHIVFVNLHHIICDGWSILVVLRELAAVYTAALDGQPSSLPPLPIQYADYAAWQRKWLQGEVLERLLSYWRQQLAGAPALLDLPSDRLRPAIQTYRGGMETLALPAPLAARLRDLSRKEGVTLYMTLLALFQVLLQRYTGQEDLIVGTPIANRNRAEVEGLIGFFVNSLVLRTDLSGDPSFHELLERVREVTLEAYAHQDLSFDKLVEELSPERSLSHTPLFQVFFNMVNLPEQAVAWPELTVDLSAPGEAGAKFDLTLYATDRGEDILLELLYNKDLFDQPRMIEMLHQFAHLASQVYNGQEKIVDLSLVTAPAQRFLPDPTRPLSERWEGSVQCLFEQQSWRNPERLAVVDATEKVTYQELDLLSNRLAHYLRAHGIVHGDVIAIYGHRSAPLIWAILGILKAGAAFLILDPAYPAARLIEYLNIANVRGLVYIKAAGALPAELETFLVASESRCLLELPRHAAELADFLAACSSDNPGIVVGPDDIACITFTSGSTGHPKGVLQKHGPLSHFLPWQQQRFGLLEAERYSLLSGLSHDPLQREIFTSLHLGGTIYIPPPEQIGTPRWLAQWMRHNDINIAHLTPAMLQILTQAVPATEAADFEIASLRRAFVVGDALTQYDVSRLYRLAPSVTCINTYGATETQRALSYFVVPRTESLTPSGIAVYKGEGKEIIPLGQGFQDVQLLVLNGSQKLAGIGELGEIYIRSPHLAKAYLNDKQSTAERFLHNPFIDRAGDRLYKTGDLGRYAPDGNVEFVGRNDEQIKLRGFRIEPAEIEAALRSHPAVREAAIIAREDTPGQKRLIAYIVPSQTQPLLIDDLRNFLAARLPGYMVPSVFVLLESLPLLPNHKLDRHALPLPESVVQATEITGVPRTPTEEILVSIWAETLNVAHVGRDDNFFELGGHSLTATQLMARIYDILHQEVPLRALFEAPTVAELAIHLDHQRSGDIALKKQAIVPLSREHFRVEEQHGHAEAFVSSHASSTVSLDAYLFPASFAQERLWFLDQLGPGSAAYTIMAGLHIHGELRLQALHQSVQALVQRHEILRTTLVEVQGRLMQVIVPSLNFSPTVIDLSGLREDEQKSHVQHYAQNESKRSFNLMHSPLFSLILLCLSAEEHILLFSIHHSIADDWSMGLFFQELDALYTALCEGKRSHLQKLPLQYADYVVWQREWLQGETLARLLAYWKGHLEGAPALLALPTDHARPPIQTYRGARHAFALPASLTHNLEAMSRRHNVTLYMTLLAAFELLLARYSGQQDLVIGTPIAGRQMLALEGLIGFFVNTLALRGDLSGNPTVRELLGRACETTLAAYAHQNLPFEKLVEELAPERQLGYSPLFQVMFILQNTPAQPPKLGDLTVTSLQMERVTAKFDLLLMMWQEEGKLHGSFEYNADLFELATIERMVGHWQTLLGGMVADPDQRISRLPLLSETERQQMLAWNETPRISDAQSLPALFQAQVARFPERIALVWEDQQLSYGELEARANQLAHALQLLGVEPEVLVGLCVERSLELVIAVLGVLKAGGAYVPLDPSTPRERLAFQMQDAQLDLVLTDPASRASLPEHLCRIVDLEAEGASISQQSREPVCGELRAEQLAYVIYTSGSTGQPKGVMVSHAQVSRLFVATAAHFGFGSQDCWSLFHSFAFDFSVWEMWGALLCGGRLVVVPYWQSRSPAEFARLLASQHVTVLNQTPSAFRQLQALEEADRAEWRRGLRWVIFGGEALLPQSVQAWLQPQGEDGPQLVNMYGITETTVHVTRYELSERDGKQEGSPLGRPLPEWQVYVLDGSFEPVPVGVAGEMYVGGAGVSRGYLRRPELTAERFVPHPFSQQPGARLYRSGDLARYKTDGTLEYLGRGDAQVKLRGYRIELGEIEAVLNQHPAVQESAVVFQEDVTGEKRLVAYVVPRAEGSATSTSGLRTFLAGKLPEYMLPAALVRLPALPLTSNGKVDRRRLSSPGESAFSVLGQEATELREETGASPRTPVEDLLIQLWEEVLHLERVGLHDNFFELGGHSLLATQLLARIRAVFQIEIPLRTLFTFPTVTGLAQQIEAAQRTDIHSQMPPITRVSQEQPLLLSYAQQRLWFLDQWEAETSLYNIPIALRLTGQLDVNALQRSLREIVQRHQALRTTFIVQDEQPQQVINAASLVSFPLVDLQRVVESGTGDMISGGREELIQRLMTAEAHRPFNLSRGPLFRLVLVRVTNTEHILLFTMHHIISDGWSVDVLFHELNACYAAFIVSKPSPLPPLPIQYSDYAIWQRAWLQGEVLEQHIAYWKGHLEGAPALLALPTDHPRPPIQTYRGARHAFALPACLTHDLEAMSRQHDVTLYMTLLAAFELLLARYSGQQDLVIGTPIAGRQMLALECLIGFFVNTLALRGDLSGNPTVHELLGRVREATLSAYAHQDLPFEKLVEELAPERQVGYSLLFQVMFILQNTPAQPPKLGDLTVTSLRMERVTAKFDLTLVMWQEGALLQGYFEYNADLFECATIARMVGHWQTLLGGMVADPEQRLSHVPLLTGAEHQQILLDWNATEAAYALEESLPHLFERQVQYTPDAIASVFEEHALSYSELNRRANQAAHALHKSGVGPGILVGLCVERSLDMLVGVLGILKAGAAYVPLDPTYPRERLAFILGETQVPIVLTQQRLLPVLPEADAHIVLLDTQWAELAREAEDNPPRVGGGEELAYVIYTSGSTGLPKGVLGLQRATLNRLYWMWERFPFTPGESCCQKTSLSFVDSIWEIFGPLLHGVRAVIIADALVKDAERLVSTLAEQGITRIVLVPSLLHAILDSRLDVETDLSHVQYWVSSGEALPAELAERFLNGLPHSTLLNLYGSSEVAADVTYALVGRGQGSAGVPIGRPVANTRVYLLDVQRQPVPIGVPGEIYIGGANLARGYLKRPELTAERFVPDPFGSEPGARLYKTGDLARYLPDGNLEYLGRRDRQAKVRGYRIELQEIEAALAQHPAVSQNVVVVRDEASGDRRLVAYVVPRQGEGDASQGGQALRVAGLRAFLKEKLPEYMLPARFVMLETLPLTPNGKIDQDALPAPGQEVAELGETETEARPSTPVEEVVAGIWADVLELEHVDVFDNFFEVGGHSLLATRVISRVRSLFQVDISVIELFEEPTVAGLAETILKQEVVPGQITAMANVRLKLKHMSASEVHAQLGQIKKARGK